MVFFILLLLPVMVQAAADVRFGFVGTGGQAFSEKFKLPYYTLEGNYPVSGNVFSSVDPNNDPPAGHKVVREVAKLNVRNDALGQTNTQFQTAFQAYIQSLATWYEVSIGPKPTFTWYSPNTAALAAAESLQIVTTIRREKTATPAVTGTVWEIGNEPNLFPALLPSEYADLFSRYYRIIKNEDATAKVAFGSIFLRETAEDLKPRMQELLQQLLISNGLLTLLGQTKFDLLQADAQNTLFSRIFNLGTVEYVNQSFSAMSSSVHPDYITLHVYPYDDRSPTLTKANIKTKVDSLTSFIATILSGRGFTAPVWITEFGNINSSLTETTVASNTSDLIDIFTANSSITGWFYYKATGADQQFSLLPGMTPALTRLATDSAFSPVDSNFSCIQLNAIGRTYYLRSTGASCVDPTVPDSPTSVIAIPGNAQAVVFWTAPTSSGGSVITGYTVKAVEDSSKLCITTAATVTCTVTGLTNGTSYTFRVTATNAVGNGIASSPSTAVIPKGPPNAPTTVNAIAGNAQATVSWKAPTFNGGSAITGYTARAVQDTTRFCSVDSLSCIVTGLTNGTSYTFSVFAINAIGKSAASTASTPAVIPKTVPDTASMVTGTPGNARVTLTWVAAGNGGSAITRYTATATQDTARHCTTTGGLTCSVTGLKNGSSYTFTVKATNTVGSGLPSTPSAALIPRTVPGAPTGVTRVSGNTKVTLTWIAPDSTGGFPITGYKATAVEDTGKHCATTDTLGCVITGLTNGTSYTFTVRASTIAGAGAASAATLPITPATIPGAPTAVVAIPGNKQAAVSWKAPDSDGGSAIIAYTVTALQDNSKSCGTFGNLTCVVTGLSKSVSYTFVVTASNILGTSAASDPSTPGTSIKIPLSHPLPLLRSGLSLTDLLGRIFRNQKTVHAETP